MARKRRTGKLAKGFGTMLTLGLTLPATYLFAALAGSLVPVNRDWAEPAHGISVFIADNGVHSDIVMPVDALGLDWRTLLPRRDFQSPDPTSRWIALGAGDRAVYLNTPTWWDLRLGTIWSALAGGSEVIHAEYVTSPTYAQREIRLRPEDYRRLWVSLRAGFALDSGGKPVVIHHRGYGLSDAFYQANGKASLLVTCNSWLANRLRLAGIKTSLWPPFAEGLIWRYRENQRT